MDDLLKLGMDALEAQPFSRFIGAELAEFSEGRTEIRVPMRDELKQQNGFAHGGVISYAADNALTFVGGSVLGPSVLTSEYKINYTKPATGEVIIARASVVSHSKFQAVCRCDIFSASGKEETLCATAQGTIVSTAR